MGAAVGGRLVVLAAVGRADVFAAVHGPLVQGYALDASHARTGKAPAVDAVEAFVFAAPARMTTINPDLESSELRNNISAVLREVEAGGSLRVTVRGKAVADLVPVAVRKRGLWPEELARIVADAPLDPGFAADLDAATGARIDEL